MPFGQFLMRTFFETQQIVWYWLYQSAKVGTPYSYVSQKKDLKLLDQVILSDLVNMFRQKTEHQCIATGFEKLYRYV